MSKRVNLRRLICPICGRSGDGAFQEIEGSYRFEQIDVDERNLETPHRVHDLPVNIVVCTGCGVVIPFQSDTPRKRP